MNYENPIVGRILDAKGNSIAADALIGDYMPFIKSETYKTIGRLPAAEHDDALSIAMFAFYEAIESYVKLRGAFLPYAALLIKRKIIDHLRKESRHTKNISMEAPLGGEEDFTLKDTLASETDDISGGIHRQATKAEITEISAQLKTYGLTLSHVADNCPKQERTMEACMKALNYAREHTDIIEEMLKTGKLPLARLATGSGVGRKTLERHRKYIMTLMLIYSNGYEIIRGHLMQITAAMEGGVAK